MGPPFLTKHCSQYTCSDMYILYIHVYTYQPLDLMLRKIFQSRSNNVTVTSDEKILQLLKITKRHPQALCIFSSLDHTKDASNRSPCHHKTCAEP